MRMHWTVAALLAVFAASAANAQITLGTVAASAAFGGGREISTVGEAQVVTFPDLVCADGQSFTIAPDQTNLPPRIPRGLPGGIVRIRIEANVAAAKYAKDGRPKQNVKAAVNSRLYDVRVDEQGWFLEIATDDPKLEKGILRVVSLVDAVSGRVYDEIPIIAPLARLVGMKNAGVIGRDGKATASRLSVLLVVDYPWKEDPSADRWECWNKEMDRYGTLSHQTPKTVIVEVNRQMSSTLGTLTAPTGNDTVPKMQPDEVGPVTDLPEGFTPGFGEEDEESDDPVWEPSPEVKTPIPAPPTYRNNEETDYIFQNGDIVVKEDRGRWAITARDHRVRLTLTASRPMDLFGPSATTRRTKVLTVMLDPGESLRVGPENLVLVKVGATVLTVRRSNGQYLLQKGGPR